MTPHELYLLFIGSGTLIAVGLDLAIALTFQRQLSAGLRRSRNNRTERNRPAASLAQR